MSHQQIADMLGSSVGAVKANFFHALANLKKILGSSHDAPHSGRTHRRRGGHCSAPERQAHLAACEACRRELAELSERAERSAAGERARAVAALLAALLAARARRRSIRRRRRHSNWPAWLRWQVLAAARRGGDDRPRVDDRGAEAAIRRSSHRRERGTRSPSTRPTAPSISWVMLADLVGDIDLETATRGRRDVEPGDAEQAVLRADGGRTAGTDATAQGRIEASEIMRRILRLQ